MSEHLDAVVVGAGPAGLAASRELARAGIAHVVLERGRVGQTWANLYDSLVLHTGKHLSALPGMPFPRGTPLFPGRAHVLEYLERYARTFCLPIESGVEVVSISGGSAASSRGAGAPANPSQPGPQRWTVRTAGGAIDAKAVVVATGIVSNPHVPSIAGREHFQGRMVHSVEYRRPGPFVSRRVLVVGAGNSAGEIAAELAHHGAHVCAAVRSGARVVPRQLLGVPIQYLAAVIALLPRGARAAVTDAVARASQVVRGAPVLPPPQPGRCSDIPIIGFHLVDGLRAGTIRLMKGVAGMTATGARFEDGSEEDFDDVILATGYRPALGVLGGAIGVDACGFALRRGRVASAERHGLYFVGHNYDIRGGLRNLAPDARAVAGLIARQLAG
jgi:NAD(P)-dependent dehydrogenase (short-subunit alcohol dehydrogenase family)